MAARAAKLAQKYGYPVEDGLQENSTMNTTLIAEPSPDSVA